jgi:hypothetical protein
MNKTKKLAVALAVGMLAALLPTFSRADQWDKKTIVTFNQPIEIPGKVLPAGTYTFKLLDSPSNRHIVQILDKDGIKVFATILAIPNYRLTPTGDTVVNFAERPSSAPQAMKAWFYPGDNFGQAFAYPKARALQLARSEHEPVPALTVEPRPETLATVPLIAVTPEEKEEPIAQAIQTTPPAAQTPAAAPVIAQQRELPHTASPIPLIALGGFMLIAVGLGLKVVLRSAGQQA